MAIELTSTMKNDVKELFGNIHNVLSIHCKLNKLSMIILQSMCFNGFKRWHRCRARELFELDLCLYNELFDKFRIVTDFKVDDIVYNPKTLEEHLKSWSDALLDGVEKLGSYNKQYFELTGMSCDIADRCLDIFIDDYTKVNRYYHRFSDSDWLTLDTHIVDDKIHECFKEKEKCYEY